MIMNKPEARSFDENDIIQEYLMIKDIKRTAKVFNVSVPEVRKVLKNAGIN